MPLPTPATIAAAARKAALMEAGASPKPGLVCPDHNGSHKDMDYPLFVASANALHPYFLECAELGAESSAAPPDAVFPLLREAGVRGEKAMFAATNGVNTHKGMIFSLGLAAAGAGRLAGKGILPTPERTAQEAAAFVKGIVARDLEPLTKALPNRPLTAGEKLYLEHGVPGIRQEAENGYPAAMDAHRFLIECLSTMPLEKALPQTLLRLMSRADDTNILWRSGPEGLAYARAAAKEALAKGGVAAEEGERHVHAMRDEFVRRNISPGGSADLLALALFFFLLSRPEDAASCA